MATRQDYAYRLLTELIFSGKYAAGTRLPNEVVLARQLGVSRSTLRAALAKLEDAGLVHRSRSQGTVVRHQTWPTVLLVAQTVNRDDFSNPYLYLIPGIEARCRELGWRMEIVSPKFLRKIDFDQPDIVGIISAQHNISLQASWLKYLQDCPWPVVQVHSFHRDPKVSGFATVMTNYAQAWCDGLKKLRELGHRKIAIINHQPSRIYRRFKLSEKTMLKIMGQLGAQTDWEVIYHPYPDGFEALAASFAAMETPPTALYCFSDWFALKMYEALGKYQLRIPEDVAVMGFSGAHRNALITPALSTVDLGYERQGRIAVELLAQHQIWENLPEKPIIFAPHSVVLRASTEKFIFNLSGETK